MSVTIPALQAQAVRPTQKTDWQQTVLQHRPVQTANARMLISPAIAMQIAEQTDISEILSVRMEMFIKHTEPISAIMPVQSIQIAQARQKTG